MQTGGMNSNIFIAGPSVTSRFLKPKMSAKFDRGAPIACGVGKNERFSTNDSLYLENDKDKRIVSIEVEYEFCRTVTLPVTLSASRLNAQVYYTLVDYNPLIPLLFQFVLDLLYKLSLHCCAAVGKILSDTWRRAVRLR